MYGYHNMYHNMMGWGGGIGMIIFWVVLIVAIIFLLKYLLPRSNERAEHKETPQEILKRRYASGEIDKAEYEVKSKDLRN